MVNNITVHDNRTTALKRLISEYKLEVGIEVGVRWAWLARVLVRESSLKKIYGVDIDNCINAINLQHEFPERYQFIQGKSPDISSKWPDHFFDFIHIDADHSYNAVVKDLDAWWPKLKVGGIYSGDDYFDDLHCGEGKFGVMQAVNEFATKHNLTLFVTGSREHDFEKLKEECIQREITFQAQKRDWELVPQWWFVKDK